MKKKLWFLVIALLAIAAVCILVHNSTNQSPSTNNSASYNACSVGNGVYIDEIEEYEKFISTVSRLPEDFITVDKLAVFGTCTFYSFICESKTDFNDYSYSIVMPNGLVIHIRIIHGSYDDPLPQSRISTTKIGSDMRTLTSAETGMFIRNGIKYGYVNGHLIQMLWQTNDITFDLGVNSNWDNYPAFPSDSVIYKMLSASESEQASAIGELNAIVTGSNLETE